MVAKAFELRKKSKSDLESQLVDLKKELASLRVQKVANGASAKVTKIHDVRKDIARVLTVINLSQREQVREFYKTKKYIPKDLRAKKTRALRRALTSVQKYAKTDKQRKAEIAFPQRKFALKA
ncbi:hypothetical protein NADFUDRAFT_41738 [Nadsonia fulvescens var. elongata DSM 6958]|uniref:60S ribosomal protein L35 n=1 Tax=Nadsonia fulvescens var. elongata DSM 6958 TaxID=857566 RepID=A0A1E3PLP2_9ASCO|nr:hypothetical protein NADFUDRAFT_41738 [Nadsonia fulvescens var. elongata DSM 6958]